MTTMQISSDGRFYLVSYGWCYSLKHALHLTKPHEYSWMIKWPLEAFGLEVKHCHLMIYSFFLGSCWKYHGYFDHTLPWHLISSSFLSLCLFKCFMMMMMWGFFWVDLFNLLHNQWKQSTTTHAHTKQVYLSLSFHINIYTYVCIYRKKGLVFPDFDSCVAGWKELLTCWNYQ
mgnify:CR=1 FL=1